MKKVLVCKEIDERETRVALIPDDVKKLTSMGFDIKVVSGAGLKSGFSDEAYKNAGAALVAKEEDAYDDSEIIVRIMKPTSIEGIKKDTLHLSYMDPFNEKELLNNFASKGIQAVSLEMIPRSTLAQKMDVQSSQTSLAGYVAVLNAAAKLPKILPMMVTPAGTINPARVFIIGVGDHVRLRGPFRQLRQAVRDVPADQFAFRRRVQMQGVQQQILGVRPIFGQHQLFLFQ